MANSERKKNQNNSEDDFQVIKETRKKKPEDYSRLGRKILITAFLAVFAGVLAAFLFVLCVPLFQKITGTTVNQTEKVEIASSSEEETEEEAQTEEEEAETEEEALQEEEEQSALEQYTAAYQEMAEAAKTAEASMVEVIGITSSLDYFNHDYENSQSLSGLLVAESSTNLYCLVESGSLKKAEEIQVIFCDGSRLGAEYKASDSETGLAILSINRSEISDATWNSIGIASFGNYSSLGRGTPIIAVGSILGRGDSIEYGFVTSTDNIVSLWDVNYNVITTDLLGSTSGSGCLLNLKGEVVGFLNQNIGSEEENLVAAIPVKQLSSLIEDLINDVPQIRIGIKGQTVTSDISESSGIPRGVLVTEVDSESPAMYAGIKELDVITAVDGENVDSFQAYSRIIAALAEGEEVQVDAMRMGKENYEEISFQLKPETK